MPLIFRSNERFSVGFELALLYPMLSMGSTHLSSSQDIKAQETSLMILWGKNEWNYEEKNLLEHEWDVCAQQYTYSDFIKAKVVAKILREFGFELNGQQSQQSVDEYLSDVKSAIDILIKDISDAGAPESLISSLSPNNQPWLTPLYLHKFFSFYADFAMTSLLHKKMDARIFPEKFILGMDLINDFHESIKNFMPLSLSEEPKRLRGQHWMKFIRLPSDTLSSVVWLDYSNCGLRDFWYIKTVSTFCNLRILQLNNNPINRMPTAKELCLETLSYLTLFETNITAFPTRFDGWYSVWGLFEKSEKDLLMQYFGFESRLIGIYISEEHFSSLHLSMDQNGNTPNEMLVKIIRKILKELSEMKIIDI